MNLILFIILILIIIVIIWSRKKFDKIVSPRIEEFSLSIARKMNHKVVLDLSEIIAISSLVSSVIFLFEMVNEMNRSGSIFGYMTIIFISLFVCSVSMIIITILQSNGLESTIFKFLSKFTSVKMPKTFWTDLMKEVIAQVPTGYFFMCLVLVQFYLVGSYWLNMNAFGHFMALIVIPFYVAFWVYWSDNNQHISARRIIAYFALVIASLVVSDMQFNSWDENLLSKVSTNGYQWWILLNTNSFVALDRLFKALQDSKDKWREKNGKPKQT